MRRQVPIFVLTALLASMPGCNVDKLVEPAPTRALAVDPSSADVRASAGSTEPRTVVLHLRSTRSSPVPWNVQVASPAPWLTMDDTAGTTPDSLTLTLDPSGMANGVYRDTLTFVPGDAGLATTQVAITFQLGACAPTTITLDATVTDSLQASDCSSTRREGRFARRYQFTGTAGDSVSFALSSADLDAYLYVDSSQAAGAAPFAESGSCVVEGTDACLRYVRLPRSGSYTVEVTSADGGPGTGRFTLEAGRPRAPTLADPYTQLRIDSTTGISVGGAIPETEFLVRGAGRDADPGDSLTLEVEVRAVDSALTGVPTATGAPRRGPATLLALATGLRDGVGYHWRARVTDETGRPSAWRAFGGNAENAADLRVAVAANHLSFQQQPTSTTSGATLTPAVTVAALDHDGNPVTTFTGTVTVTLSGGTTGAALSGKRSVSAVAGVATFDGLSIDLAGSGYVLSAGAAGLVDARSEPFAITAGAATHLIFTQQPSGAAPGRAIAPPVVVTALDAHENVASSYTGAVTIALGRDGSVLHNAALSGTLTVTAAAGRATFSDLRLDQPGIGYTLVARASGLTSGASTGFDVTPLGGSPTRQAFSGEPSNSTAGRVISPAVAVAVLDAQGQVVDTFSGPVTLHLFGGDPAAALGGRATMNADNGVARFGDLSVDRPATGYRLRASSPGLPDAESGTFTVGPAPPSTGALAVIATTSGDDLDPDGYSLTVGDATRPFGINASLTLTGLSPGPTTVALGGVAGNCHVGGDDPRAVTVVAGDTTTTAFTVTCTKVGPTTGALTVTTNTTGNDLDPDGYTVDVNGDRRTIGASGSLDYSGLAPGGYAVALTGIAGNCSVSGANPRTVDVTAGVTATAAFSVACIATPPPPPEATRLGFLQQPPSLMPLGGMFGVLLVAYGDGGGVATGYRGDVTLVLTGALPGTTLQGTLTRRAASGVAAFGDLRLTGPCVGCRLIATSGGLLQAVSDPFTVVVP